MAVDAMGRLRGRARRRALCGRCQRQPHEVRVRIEVREKAVNGDGSGSTVASSYASLCAECANDVLDNLKETR